MGTIISDFIDEQGSIFCIKSNIFFKNQVSRLGFSKIIIFAKVFPEDELFFYNDNLDD